MATTNDPIGEFVDLLTADADPTVEGQIGYRAGAFRLKDSVGVYDPRAASGISSITHRTLDQLVHEISETSYDQYVYTGNRVDAIVTWTTALMVTKIREQIFTYTGNLVSTVVTKQYDGLGVILTGETMTETFAYTGNKVTSVTRTLA